MYFSRNSPLLNLTFLKNPMHESHIHGHILNGLMLCLCVTSLLDDAISICVAFEKRGMTY